MSGEVQGAGGSGNWVKEARLIVQDLIAPELRSLGVKLDALEKRFEESDKRNDVRFAEAERRSDLRFTEAEKRSDQRFVEAEKRADLRFAEADKRAEERDVRIWETLKEMTRRADQRDALLSETLVSVKLELGAMRTQLDLTNKLEALAARVNEMSLSKEQH